VKRLRRGAKTRFLRWTRRARELDRGSYGRLVDYHVHTRLCGHAVGEPEDYVRVAISKGLSEIGFADHMPLLRLRDERLTMAPEDLPEYVDLVRDLQDSVDEVKVRLGIEMDYLPGQMDEIWDAASRYEFDYVYGAVHYIDGWGFSDSRRLSSYEGRDPDETYARYFELFREAVREGGFDVMAHPDLVKKHGLESSLALDDLYRDAADEAARADVAIEVNTSGLRKRAVDLYPSLPFLRACAERGVAVTLGSDAHAPGQVGMDFDLALDLLRKAGITEIATFESRERRLRPLSGPGMSRGLQAGGET
jgi:histidinol-phosphatase (PHP family)